MMSTTTLRVFLTARDTGARLTEQPALPVASADDASLPRLAVNTERRFQTHLGFGGAFTEAAATVWQSLPESARTQLLRDYFDPAIGHGYTLGRVHMNSCDFALGNYAHVEQPDDFALESFNIERDRRALLPFIQAALRVADRPIQLPSRKRSSTHSTSRYTIAGTLSSCEATFAPTVAWRKWPG